MKVTELKEELEVCVEGVSGNKVWLRRHLHAVIVREYSCISTERWQMHSVKSRMF